MTSEQRVNAANEINGLWVRHVRYGEPPPDVDTVAKILERHELRPTGAGIQSTGKSRTRLRIVGPSQN
jgi:hypothetical protein